MNLENVIRLNVILLRERKGWTQDELAIQIGKSRSFVALLESGRRGIRTEYLDLLSSVFDVSPDYFCKEHVSILKKTHESVNSNKQGYEKKEVGAEILLNTEVSIKLKLLYDKLMILTKEHRINSLLYRDKNKDEKAEYEFGRGDGIDEILSDLEEIEFRRLHASENPKELLEKFVKKVEHSEQEYRMVAKNNLNANNIRGECFNRGRCDSLYLILSMMEEMGLYKE